MRSSRVHGRGVFALRPLEAGVRLLPYRGEVVSWREAVRRHDRTGIDGVTYFFDLENGTVVDGAVGGNSTRFLNHSCRPNCEAVDQDGTMWFYTLEPIAAGQELLIDYQLSVDDETDPDERARYACRCGSVGCRGTMLGSSPAA